MKLEQTIQRSKKSTSGIIGQSRQTSYVTEWELVYYEILAISNIFTSIASDGLGFRETDLHHELSGSLTKVLSDSVDKVFNFLLERNNPYDVKETTKLHHFTTGHIVFDEHAKRLLSFFDHGQANYIEFCKERYINKTKILSDRITKNQLPLFQSNRKDANKAVPNKEKLLLKTQGMIQKELDIARFRYMSMKDILNFKDILNLSETSILFDGDFTSKPDKHVLVSELEKYITEPYEYLERNSPTNLCVDFMSLMRRVNLSKCLTFKDSFEIVWSRITNTCAFQQVNIVFDSYLDESIKFGERERRTVSRPLVIVNMQEESHIPAQIEKFWENNSNKENLQKLAKEFCINKSIENQINAVLSGCLSDNEDRCLKAVEVRDEFVFDRADLDIDIEEADLRIIPHVSKSFSRNFTNIVVISNDTDLLILLLHYLPQFIENGLEEL